MKMQVNDAERRATHCLPESISGDIVVRLDAAGFVLNASENAVDLGMDLSSLLLMPHISDFAEAGYERQISRYTAAILDGGEGSEPKWIEFPVHPCEIHTCDDGDTCRHWYALKLRKVEGGENGSPAALGLLRPIRARQTAAPQERSRLAINPLTGPPGRRALSNDLEDCLNSEAEGTLIIFAIDRMQAMLLQHGQRAVDEIIWGFAQFLEVMVPPEHELSRVDGERFAVVLPDMSPTAAKGWAEDVLTTFAELAVSSSAGEPGLTASAGVARIEDSADWTMRQAELGLVMARAGGGMQAANAHHRTPGAPARRVSPD